MSMITLPTAEQEVEISPRSEDAPVGPGRREVIYDPHAREGRTSETLQEFHERLASIPASVLLEISPELKALTGILPADLDVLNGYAAYYEYMERKHR